MRKLRLSEVTSLRAVSCETEELESEPARVSSETSALSHHAAQVVTEGMFEMKTTLK